MAKRVLMRQGDVMMELVDEEPKGLKTLKAKGAVVLALGEVTGHMHQVESGAALLEHPKTKARFLRVVKPTALKHEEHAPVKLKPGLYRTWIQRVYSPEKIRRVED